MSTHDFVTLVTGLAWPVVIVVAMLAFREQVRQFAGRMTHVRVGGQEFVARAVDSADVLLSSISTTAHPEGVPDAFEAEVMTLAASDPRAALMRVRRAIDRRIRYIAVTGNHLETLESTTERWRQLALMPEIAGLTADLQATLILYGILEEQAVQGNSAISPEVTLRLVDQGLTILGHLNSQPIETHRVICVVPIYSDQALTVVDPGRRRAVWLRSVSAGQPEAIRAFVTSRPVFYKPDMPVGWGWNPNPPVEGAPGFAAHPETGEGTQVITWDFAGRDLTDFV